MFKSIALCVVVLLAGLLAGCQSEPKVLPATVRAPTAPEQVAIHQKAPAEYELLGRVEAPVGGEVRWDDQGHSAAGFAALKAQAAALGANGLLLSVDPGQSDFQATAGDGRTFYTVPMKANPRRAVATAIYVIKP